MQPDSAGPRSRPTCVAYRPSNALGAKPNGAVKLRVVNGMVRTLARKGVLHHRHAEALGVWMFYLQLAAPVYNDHDCAEQVFC